MHHVAVGKNESIGRKDETGPAAASSALVFNLDTDHRGTYRFRHASHHAGVGIHGLSFS